MITSPFDADDGSAPSDLTAALAGIAAGSDQGRAVMTALARGRLLVPIVAVADSTQTTSAGQVVDKESHLATVLVQGPNGERAMLAFSSSEAMANWRADARPAPVSGVGAAQTALAEGAETLLVDVAGPTAFAVTAGELRALAAAIDEGTVRGLIADLVHQIPGLQDATLDRSGETAELSVTLDPGLSKTQYRALMATLSKGLRDDERLVRVFGDGLRIRVLAPGQKPIDTPSPLPET